jgi:hypothetical protein
LRIVFTILGIITIINRWSGSFCIGDSNYLGPFNPGQILIAANPDFWRVPEQPDIYELRIYMGNDIVASALFEVK